MRVQELLDIKGREVTTIESSATVDNAIRLMADNKTSAVIVVEDSRPVGIFAERDVLRAYRANQSSAFSDMPIKEAMTNKLITVGKDEDIHAATVMMIKADIRHLPVTDYDTIVGMLIINDLVEYQLAELNAELDHLKEYLDDLHNAGQD